ncbi:hypothetical protein C0216_13315 [Streptomyces globosus]|uniref:SH3 domain-containing protein n=1 Tax=Streptomyces globosus TaxID=68209 RepID=A0A344U083_9ACTN|nr:SH3 domain-containing protein [Streptomyces globosus]AXE24304.1 hypothetical protein C0216_13315 [Streptomyces globosus]
MQKPTRAVLALAAGSLVLGFSGAGAAVAADEPARQVVLLEPKSDKSGKEHGKHYAVGKVVARGSLKVRSKPSTHSDVVGHVKADHKVAIRCKARGEKVDGNDLWYRLHLEDDDEHGKGREDRDRDDSDDRDEDEDEQDREDQDNEDSDEDADEDTDEDADEDEDADDEEADKRSGRPADDGKAAKATGDHKRAWVAARYVKNLDHVDYCGN